MPAKKHLTKTDGAEGGSPDGPKPAAQAIGTPSVRERSTAPPPPPDSLAAVTARLGARYWTTNKRFDWALAPNRHHYEFTRYYFEQLVILDVWESANPSARRESERKRACVDAENVRRVGLGQKPIGLLSIVRGAVAGDEHFEAAMRGETMDLIERVPEGALV